MSRTSLRIYVVRDVSGLLTGRLVPRSSTRAEYAVTGSSEQELEDRLLALLSAQPDPESALGPFTWSETLHVDRVLVEVRPQVALGKRTVIGKQRIPLELSYVWAALAGERSEGTPAGFRVMLPRFGFWFVLEELSMAAEVLRQAVSSTLAGEAARSLFEFREVALEYVLEWSPRFRKQKRRDAEDREDLEVLRSVAEEWASLGRAGKLGSHFGPVEGSGYERLLGASRKPSVLLVGPSGVGKTEWVRELARRAGRAGRAASAEAEIRVWSTSADRIMSGQTYLGMWEQRCLELVGELRGEGHFLFVDRLSELVRPRSGASSIADLLAPALHEGAISVIAECTNEEYQALCATHASLLSSFEIVRLDPPTTEQVCALIAEYQERVAPALRLETEAVRRAVRHLELFRKSSAFPGKALAFLQFLANSGVSGGVANAREVDRLFSKFSGLAERLVSDHERASSADIAASLQRRVVGQDEACASAARVLARFKAGVNDPDKPLGSLLFVGPTGVGKTELAKELARFLFGSSERLVRLDMSELMLPSSVGRLLSDERGSASLAQRVSQEPLSVVLLDEIEKAHPAVFDVLLGLLGEGRLTTTSGRLVDFRMTLVLMTSNLGSGATRVGFGASPDDAQHLRSAVRAHFRPEFVNRLDQIVTFDALSPVALQRIVELALDDLAEREGLRRRNLRLVVSDAAKAQLARWGHDPEYGARPLKRVIEERLVMPIAVELSRRPQTRDAVLRVELVDGALRLELRPA